MELSQRIGDHCLSITDRLSTKHVQCKAVLNLISCDSIWKNDKYVDVYNSIWAVLALLDLADCDLTELEGELELLEPGVLAALMAKTPKGVVEAKKHNGGAS